MSKKNKAKQVKKKNIIEKLTEYPWSFLFFIILTIITYSQITDFGLIEFDDKRIIDKANTTSNVFTQIFETDPYFENTDESRFYRPVQNMSIILDKSVNSSDYTAFHLTNLLLHLFTVFSIFYLLCEIGYKRLNSLFLSAIFLVHPLLSFSVAWIPARGDLLISLFSVLSLIFFHKYLIKNKLVYALISSLFIAFAVFSKETAIVLPFILIIYFIFNYSKISHGNSRKIKIQFFILSLFWISILLIFLIIKGLIFTKSNISFEFGFYEFINNLRYYPEYFYKFFNCLSASVKLDFLCKFVNG